MFHLCHAAINPHRLSIPPATYPPDLLHHHHQQHQYLPPAPPPNIRSPAHTIHHPPPLLIHPTTTTILESSGKSHVTRDPSLGRTNISLLEIFEFALCHVLQFRFKKLICLGCVYPRVSTQSFFLCRKLSCPPPLVCSCLPIKKQQDE